MFRRIAIFISLFHFLLGNGFCSELTQSHQNGWNAKEYFNNSSTQQDHAEVILNRIQLKGKEKILDVGCGDGRVTIELAKRLPQGQLIGVDPSVSMISYANSLKNNLNAKNTQFLIGKAETFSLDRKFDLALAIHVMHWVKEQKVALKNIYNHLEPQGKIFFVIASSKEGLPFDAALKKTLSNWHEDFVGFENNQYFYDMETYRKLLTEARFHVNNITYTYYQKSYNTKEELAGWLKQWLPHYKYLSKEKRDDFLENLVSNYLEISKKQNGKINWDEYVLFIEASKLSG